MFHGHTLGPMSPFDSGPAGRSFVEAGTLEQGGRMGDKRHGSPERDARVTEWRRAWFDGWTEGVSWTLLRTLRGSPHGWSPGVCRAGRHRAHVLRHAPPQSSRAGKPRLGSARPSVRVRLVQSRLAGSVPPSCPGKREPGAGPGQSGDRSLRVWPPGRGRGCRWRGGGAVRG